MVSFDYVEPPTLERLIEQLAQAGSEGTVLAGGTDLLVKVRAGLAGPRVLFDMGNLRECREVADEGQRLRIGAAVRMNEIVASKAIQRKAPSLAAAARQMSSTQIRNRATLGGNIMTASPAADAVPPLLAAAASLVLAGPKGEREVLLSDFLLGPGKTALAESEVLTHILLPVEGGRGRSHFIKVGQRNAMAISVVNFAGWTKVNPNGRVDDIRIVLGAVAPTAIRARRAEQAIISTTPDSNTLAEAARLAAEECRPISDLRGTAAGRRLLVEAWTLRLLQQLLGNQSSAGYQS